MSNLSRISIFLLLIPVAFLIGLGLIMLASTSPWAEPDHMQYSHVKKQVIFLLIGLTFAAVSGFTPIRWIERLSWPLFIVACILLALCYVPGVQVVVNGSARWIKFPVLGQFQPSEASKICVSVALSWWMVHIARAPRQYLKGYLYPFIVLALPAGLIFMEKDMGTTAVIIGSAMLMLYVAGTRWWLLLATAVLGVTVLILYVNYAGGNRAERLLAFQDLEATKLDYGLQQWRSLLAFANGGISGVGLGNGAEKHGYLPFAHTDFIFPIIGEELGLRATLAVIFCFVMITVAGTMIAQRTPDRFSALLAIGLTANIVIPGAMNIGVATALLPNTGLPLPFVSYGGSNLLFTLASVGILTGIYFRSPLPENHFVQPQRRKRIIRL